MAKCYNQNVRTDHRCKKRSVDLIFSSPILVLGVKPTFRFYCIMRSFQLIKVPVCPEETVLVFLEETSMLRNHQNHRSCETIEAINVVKPPKPSRLRNHRNHPLTWALGAGGNRLPGTGGTGGSGRRCRVFKKTSENPSR